MNPITPAFTKLQRSILTSSIWLADAPTRLVWITLLALCDRDGIARVSPAMLSHHARVEPLDCERAVATLTAPDADSRDMSDGCRIERVQGGYRIINYLQKLQEGARQERTEYLREKQAEHRAKKKAAGGTIRPEHRDDASQVKLDPRGPSRPLPGEIAAQRRAEAGLPELEEESNDAL